MTPWLDAGREAVRLIRSQWHEPERLERLQAQRLRAQLAHARSTVPFYRDRADADWIAVERGEAPLHALPVIRREQVQAERSRLLSEWGERAAWRTSRTSGSTGRPLESAFDPNAWLLSKYAFKLRRLAACGWRPGRRVVVVEAERPARSGDRAHAWDLVRPRRFLSVFEPPTQHLPTYAIYRPHYIYGFPSYLAALLPAWGAQERARVPLRALMTSGEWLSPELRRRLETGFGVPVLDVYGSTEFKEIAWQCPHRDGYHVNMEGLRTEIVDEAGAPVPPGTSGEVVVTSLINRAMPLIRYATGDRAEALAGRCGCGRGSTRLDRIAGRIAETLELPDGTELSPYALTTAVEGCGLRQFRIVQRLADRLDVWIVAGDPPVDATDPDPAERVRTALGPVVGSRVELCIQAVRDVPRDPSGKCAAVSRASPQGPRVPSAP